MKGTSCLATRMKATAPAEGRPPRQRNASVLVAVLLSEIHKVSAQYGMQSGKCLLANCTSSLAPKATIFSLPSVPTFLPTYLSTFLPTYLPTWPQYLVAVVYVILLFRIVPLKKHSQGCSFRRCGGGDDRRLSLLGNRIADCVTAQLIYFLNSILLFIPQF